MIVPGYGFIQFSPSYGWISNGSGGCMKDGESDKYYVNTGGWMTGPDGWYTLEELAAIALAKLRSDNGCGEIVNSYCPTSLTPYLFGIEVRFSGYSYGTIGIFFDPYRPCLT